MNNVKSNKEYDLKLINDYLDVFSQINNWSNHGCTFELNCMQKNGQSFSNVLDNMFSDFDDVQLEISQIDDIKYFLIKELENWFFEFQRNSEYVSDSDYEKDNIIYIVRKICFTLANETTRKEFLNKFVLLLIGTVRPKKSYKLDVITKSYYACVSLDIIFENEDEIYNLHLSIDD